MPHETVRGCEFWRWSDASEWRERGLYAPAEHGTVPSSAVERARGPQRTGLTEGDSFDSAQERSWELGMRVSQIAIG